MNYKKHYRNAATVVFLLLLGIIIECGPLWGQTGKKDGDQQPRAVELPENLTYDSIDNILSRLDDRQVRTLVMDLLEAEVDRRITDMNGKIEPGKTYQDKISHFGSRLEFMLSGAVFLPGDMATAIHYLTGGQGTQAGAVAILHLCAIIGVALIVEWGVQRKASRARNRFIKETEAPGIIPAITIRGRFLIDLVCLAVFIIMTLLPALYFFPDPVSPQRLVLTALLLIILIRTTYVTAKFFLSPRIPVMRFTGLDDDFTRFFFRWVIAISVVLICAWGLNTTLQTAGASEQGMMFLRTMTGILFAVMLMTATWANRQRLLKIASLTKDSPLETASVFKPSIAPKLNLAFMIYVPVVWVFWQIQLLHGSDYIRAKALLSFLVVPFYFIFTRMGIIVLHTVFSKKPVTGNQQDRNEGEAFTEATDNGESRRKYLQAGGNVIRIVFAVFGIGFILRLWGIDPFHGKILEACFNIFISCLLAYLLWIYIKTYIDRKMHVLDKSAPSMSSDEPGAAGERDRRFTLYPLFQKFIAIVLFLTVALIILSSIGIKIVPLLASAGIFGLAIGLGSQTLVKDVVSGIFFLIDDAFRVGDYITIEDSEGTVEKTSLRALTLRHYRGQVQVLTYGDIKSITNWSRGPMLVKFDLPLAVHTDPKKVKKIIKKINAKMLEEEEYGPNLVQPLKAQGVKSIQDGVMTIRVKFSAKPGTQFVIKREAFRRIHAALTEAGISFASREVTVNIPSELTENDSSTPGKAPGPSTDLPSHVFSGAGAASGAIISETGNKRK